MAHHVTADVNIAGAAQTLHAQFERLRRAYGLPRCARSDERVARSDERVARSGSPMRL